MTVAIKPVVARVMLQRNGCQLVAPLLQCAHLRSSALFWISSAVVGTGWMDNMFMGDILMFFQLHDMIASRQETTVTEVPHVNLRGALLGDRWTFWPNQYG